MQFKNIVVAGGGVLGSQIAFQSAFKGFHVKIWLRSEASIGRTQPKLDRLYQIYLKEVEGLQAHLGKDYPDCPRGFTNEFSKLTEADIQQFRQKIEEAYKNIKLELCEAEAFQDADLVIEAMAENREEKVAFYKRIREYLPEHTVLVTNSSTLLPSMFAEDTGRPDRYLALHFANNIWRGNTAEIMGHEGTSKEAYDAVVEFAGEIGMVPLPLKKEQPGYILNSMLVPFLSAAEALWANDVADPETIDNTWKLGTGSPLGPFQILDIVGLMTAYQIVLAKPGAQEPGTVMYKIAAKLKEYIDAGKTGVNAGEGIYKY